MNLKARNLHRDLGYFYIGLIISFALSGILMNHRDQFHAEKYNVEGSFPLVVVVDKTGKVIGKMGFKNVSPEEYIKMIHALEKK